MRAVKPRISLKMDEDRNGRETCVLRLSRPGMVAGVAVVVVVVVVVVVDYVVVKDRHTTVHILAIFTPPCRYALFTPETPCGWQHIDGDAEGLRRMMCILNAYQIEQTMHELKNE